jgi:hypothetical protein
VRLAQPKGSDEVERPPGSGRLLKGPCCHRRRFVSELDSLEKERAAASVFKTRAPHRSSCRRHARKERRRPSTEIRLGVNSALQTHGPLLVFLVVRSRFASGRDPPRTPWIRSYTPHSRLTRGTFSDKGARSTLSPLCATKSTRYRPLQLFSKQFQKVNSTNFALTGFSEVHRRRRDGASFGKGGTGLTPTLTTRMLG